MNSQLAIISWTKSEMRKFCLLSYHAFKVLFYLNHKQPGINTVTALYVKRDVYTLNRLNLVIKIIFLSLSKNTKISFKTVGNDYNIGILIGIIVLRRNCLVVTTKIVVWLVKVYIKVNLIGLLWICFHEYEYWHSNRFRHFWNKQSDSWWCIL